MICVFSINYYLCAVNKFISSMKKGTVKFFNHTKGFGFIKDEESDNEYFVHASGLVDQIRDNDVVTFDIEDGRKGPNAVNVKLA